jgi:two-component system cell cycle sensor histidine kinase PleC
VPIAQPVTLAVMAFSLVFACVIAVKLQQEWTAAHAEARAGIARDAGMIAERTAGRIAEIETAARMAATQFSVLNPRSIEPVANATLSSLVETPYVPSAAVLAPDGRVFAAGPASTEIFRQAAEAGLETRIAVQPGTPVPLSLTSPIEFADGTVGALVVLLSAPALIPEQAAGRQAFLTDIDGYLLGVPQPGQGPDRVFAVEQFNLRAADIALLAERGGSVHGAEVAGEMQAIGAARMAGAPIHALVVAPVKINQAAWTNTLIFHILLLIAPLGTAVALSARLRNESDKLDATEERLRDSEGRLRLAIESARCGVWDWDLATDEVVLTDSFAQLIGRERGERMTGPELLMLFSEDDRNRIRSAMRSAAQGLDVDVEVRVAGLAVWVQIRGRLMGEANRIVGVAIDVTERKGAQARVAAAESRLRAALESMNESFVLWDSRQRLILWNRKFREFFNLPGKKLKPGMAYGDVEMLAGRAITLAHAEDENGGYELELKDGRWLRYSERRTADGGLVSVGADITALKSQEAALKENDREMRRTVDNLRRSQERVQELAENYEQEKLRAEEANRSKSEFLANMSHELRTPLNAINGFSEIMQGEMFGPLGHERYKDYVTDILSSGQHLLSLINDILDMSKIEAGKMQLQPEPIEPAQLLEQCVRIMRARAEEKTIKLGVEGQPLPSVEADPRAIKQVLLNLMSNAVKFTPEGGKVIVRTFDAADGVVIQVADTGIGIPEEDLHRVGRPFEQIENQHSKVHQGSGLGLALSKSLIELHGGTLRIDSVLGKGTTVSFTLPTQAAVVAPSETESSDTGAEPAQDKPASHPQEGDEVTATSGETAAAP